MLKKLNLNSILWGAVFSAIIMIAIIAVGYSIGSRVKAIWPAAIMINIAFATIWLISLFNGYAEFSHSNRKFFGALRNRKNNKLGNYVEKGSESKPVKSLKEIKETNSKKSKQGPIAMYLISLITLFSTLWMLI